MCYEQDILSDPVSPIIQSSANPTRAGGLRPNYVPSFMTADFGRLPDLRVDLEHVAFGTKAFYRGSHKFSAHGSKVLAGWRNWRDKYQKKGGAGGE